MGLDDSQSSDYGVTREYEFIRYLLFEAEMASGDQKDDLELAISSRQSSAHVAVAGGFSHDLDQQLMLDDGNAQSQSEVPQEDVAHTGHEQHTEAELADDGDAVPEEPLEASQASTTGCAGSEAKPADDASKANPPVRCSTRTGAGQHSNPYHLLGETCDESRHGSSSDRPTYTEFYSEALPAYSTLVS